VLGVTAISSDVVPTAGPPFAAAVVTTDTKIA
jgi:hypothetical protein